jgi:photosystem II stability/assembly factor-like uncharacterized protein
MKLLPRARHDSRIVLAAGLLSLALLNCNSSSNKDQGTQVQPHVEKTENIAATVNLPDDSGFHAVAGHVPGPGNLLVVKFVDGIVGWAGSDDGHLFRTSDSGLTWVRKDLPGIRPHAEIADICFISRLVGWVVVDWQHPDMLKYEDDVAWIMATRDGGETWTQQLTKKPGSLGCVSFEDDQDGWAAGYLVLHTTDGGQHWSDASGDLNTQFVLVHSVKSVNHIVAGGHGMVTALSLDGHMFRTTDSSLHWEQIYAPDNERPQTGFNRFGTTADGPTWIVGGADSIEGTWGSITMSRGQGQWKKYEMVGIYLRDAERLPDGTMLACGSILRPGAIAGSGQETAMILASKDDGAAWSVVYDNPKIRTLISIAAVDANHAWAVGAHGLVVRLRR